MQDTVAAKSIAFRTDLQEQTGGISWNPAVRGFLEGDFFLIIKTFKDPSTDVRHGRKFSHVLIIRKEEVGLIDNLQGIFELLPESVDKNPTLEPIEFPLEPTRSLSGLPERFQLRFNKLIHGYINSREYSNVLIWVGQEDAEIAISELWKRLSNEERKDFTFGIAFNNDTALSNAQQLHLIVVPEGVQSKFLKSGYLLIAKDTTHIPTELAEQILIGDQQARSRITHFEKVLEIGPLSKADISIVGKGISTFENLELTVDLKKVNTLSHIIAQYAPLSKQATEYKAKLLDQILTLIRGALYPDIAVLRTFRHDSFVGSQKEISNALIEWIDNNILIANTPGSRVAFFSELKKKGQSWWDKIIQKQLTSFLNKIDNRKSVIIYSWIKEDISIFGAIESYIDSSEETEDSFLRNFPKSLPAHTIEHLMDFSVKNEWFKLYAKLLRSKFDVETALKTSLLIKKGTNNVESIKVIFEGLEPKEIISYAVQNDDIRVLKIAGELCHKDPQLLTLLDISSRSWQAIWAEAISNGNDIDTGISNAEKIISQLFDKIIHSQSISEDLLTKIASSKYGNILFYKNRAALWSKLPLSSSSLFLSKTSFSFLLSIDKYPNQSTHDDPTLAGYISKQGIDEFVYFNRKEIGNVIPVFERYSLSDNYIRDYLNHYSGSITVVQATQMGKLIIRRLYGNSAYAINNKTSGSNNWRFALTECYQLLDPISQGLLYLSGKILSLKITTDQWWQMAEDVIVELYPNKTSLTTIWKKAGGKESNLIMNGTPYDAWQDLLHKLRNKRTKGVSMNDLLKEIEKQYGGNENFKVLYKWRKDFIS